MLFSPKSASFSRGQMKRRTFISMLVGATASWPLTARAQQVERIRRVGVLQAGSSDDADAQANTESLIKGLSQLGWMDGRNLRIERRWGGGNADTIRKHATELAALAPDVILASGNAAMAPLLQATRIIPIVFVNVADPVGAGFVDSLARPGGNVTGFMQFEYSLSAKWVELLKQTSPHVTRAAVIRDPAISAGVAQFAVIQSVAPSLGVEVTPVNIREMDELERVVTAFASLPNGGLIVTASALATVNRDRIISLAAKHKLPAVYFRRHYVNSGGLISYGIDLSDQNRRAAGYIDRILKGEQAADLPVQAPISYELAINLKTARSLGLALPAALLSTADAVIE
jgi:putative tryptophan/tyrosine transport system substrate-binding protein